MLEAQDPKTGEPKPRKVNTGKQDIAAISAVLVYAREKKQMTGDPCSEFTAKLRTNSRTKSGRAGKDPTRDIRPVDVEALSSLVCEARKESLQDLIYVLLMLACPGSAQRSSHPRCARGG